MTDPNDKDRENDQPLPRPKLHSQEAPDDATKRNENRYIKRGEKRLNLFEKIVSILLILVNAGMLVAYFFLVQTGNDQVTYIKRTVELADSTMRMGNRAYITVTAVNYKVGPLNPFDIQVHLENVGHSPAYHISCYAEWDTSIQNFADRMRRIDRAMKDSVGFVSRGIMGQGKPITLHAGLMSGSRANKSRSANKVVFTYGLIVYDDIFGGHHFTSFCFFHVNVPPIDNAFAAWIAYNEAN